MSERTAIIIDGSSALPDEVQRDFGFHLLPVHVLFGDDDFTPGLDITPAQFYEKLASSKKLPSTAAPSLGECVEIYQRLAREGFRSILAITVINEASVTHTVAKTAAQQVNGARIEVCLSRGIPAPVSATMKCKPTESAWEGSCPGPLSGQTRTLTRPAGVNLIALPTRLSRI